MTIKVTMNSGQVFLVCVVNGNVRPTASSLRFRDGSGDYI